MNIYGKNCYREIIRNLVGDRKSVDVQDNFQKLAEVMRIPKSYMSKVLHGKADLSADQLYLACVHLNLSEDETEYMQILLERERTGLAARRKRLARKTSVMQQMHATADEYLAAPSVDESSVQGRAEYFLDPWATIVHMALLIPGYRDDLPLLARQLGLSPARLNETIGLLDRLKFIERRQKQIKVLVENLHLPSAATVFRAWRTGLRTLGAARSESMNDSERYTFSAVFNATKQLNKKYALRFLKL